MTDQLQQMVEQAKRLPAESQDRIATFIADELEEYEWDAIVSKPRVQSALRRMAADVQAQDARGETEEGGWEP